MLVEKRAGIGPATSTCDRHTSGVCDDAYVLVLVSRSMIASNALDSLRLVWSGEAVRVDTRYYEKLGKH